MTLKQFAFPAVVGIALSCIQFVSTGADRESSPIQDQQKPLPLVSGVVETAIDDFAKSRGFDGTILVVRDGHRIALRSYGLADRSFDVPVADKTKFRIASVTKLFTSTLIMQLAEEGQIDLSKTIGFYLPDYKGEGKNNATVRTLLNHTSGVENFDASVNSIEDALANGIRHYQLPFSTDRLLSDFCSGKLVHEPGSTFDYNNADYIILGKIIEKITGKTYEQVLREKILEPLQMTDSGMTNKRDIVKNMAPTYMTMDNGKTFVNDMPVYFENWYAAGSMYSTAVDLEKFAAAFYGAKLLKADSLEQILTPGLGGYGYGLWTSEMEFDGKKYRAVNRPGGIMGANAALRHFRGIGFDSSATIIVLSNTNAVNLDDLTWEIGKLLRDKP